MEQMHSHDVEGSPAPTAARFRSGDLTVAVADDPPSEWLDLFPAVRACTYLDTGTMGLSFAGHGEAVVDFYQAKSRGCLDRALWEAKAASVRDRLATWLDVPGGEIEFFSSTTDALNIVGHSIEWRRGDEIVLADDEFPSVQLAWSAAEKAGAVLRRIRIGSEAGREAALAAAVSPATRALVVSHVHTRTGTRLDLQRLGAVCREKEALLIVDGIHALGAVPVRLDGVDIYVSGVFKWLLAGFGFSVCVVRERARARMSPAFRGYLNQPPSQGLQFSHFNYPGLYAFDASLRLLGDFIGWAAVHARTEALVGWLADALAAGGLELAAPEGARAGLASFTVADSDASRARLAERRIHVAAKGPWLRATPFFYNSRADVARLAEAVHRHCR